MSFAKAKVLFKCPAEDKLQFSQSSCLVMVSMGNQEQRGAKFAGTVAAISRHFQECTVMVCDSLQRHTVALKLPEATADLHQAANALGDDWLRENEETFSLFTIPHSFIRWDHWLFHQGYPWARAKVDGYFGESEEYRQALLETAEIFFERLSKRAEHPAGLDRDWLIQQSLEYLKEECAVMLLWAERRYHFEIYPSARSKAMAATHEHFIKPEFGDVLKPVALYI